LEFDIGFLLHVNFLRSIDFQDRSKPACDYNGDVPARFNLMSSGLAGCAAATMAPNPFADGGPIFGIWYARNSLVKSPHRREVPKTPAA